MERKPRIGRDKKESRPIRTVWNENNDLSGGVIIGVFSNMPIQMESAVCDTNRKKGNGVFYPTLTENASPETVVRSKDMETSAGHAGNQTVFFSWRVRTESSFRMACLKCDCLADNSATWKGPFIKSVFQKQSNGARVAFPFQESGLCKHGLKSVLNVTEKMIALAMTRTKCTKRTRNRYFTSWRNAQGGIADLSWRRSVVTM